MDKIYLICYDISLDSLRSKVSKKLQYFGLERVQYSIFIGSLRPRLFKECEQWLKTVIKGKDKLLVLPLPAQIAESSLTYGDYDIPWQLISNRLNTLYID